MAAPIFFNGLNTMADKIRFNQIDHLSGPYNATTLVKVASRRINSSFQSTIGQQYKDSTTNESVDEGCRRSACSVSAVTPAQSISKSRSSIASAGVSPVPFNTTLSMPYKRLLPAQLSSLSPGDEIIVVVPSPNEHNSDVVESATVAFNKVFLNGCPRMNAKQQDEHLSHVMKQLEISRNGVVVHEFCVCILNFPELATLDNHFAIPEY
jgi:hypothetical protein